MNTASIQTLTAAQTAFLAKNGLTAEHNGQFGLKFSKPGQATDGYGGTVPAAWHIYQERENEGWNVLLESSKGCYDAVRKSTLKHCLEVVCR